MIEEMEKRLGWSRGIIVHADNGLILAMKEVNGKYPGRRFRLNLEKYRAPVACKENFLVWGKTRAEKMREPDAEFEPKHKPFRNEIIYFEQTIEGEMIGWCSNLDYLRAKSAAKKIFKKAA
jgi:hypothetical protein